MNKLFSIGIAAAVTICCASQLQAVQYIITATNVSDGDSDRVVVDNVGAVTGGDSIAAVGYFKTIVDGSVGSSATAALVSDFEILASEDFSATGAFNGLFNINTTISPAESDAKAIAGNGKSLYLFFGNGTTLGSSGYVGLIDTGSNTPDVTAGAAIFNTDVDYSGSNFASGGTIILGQLTNDNVAWGGGTSTGSFELVLVPEPSSALLLGLGGVAFFLRRRR